MNIGVIVARDPSDERTKRPELKKLSFDFAQDGEPVEPLIYSRQ